MFGYFFRHSTLTNLAKVFTEARLEHFAGWVHGSKMSRRYVHFSARDLEDAVLELHGLKKPDEMRNIPQLVNCPRCGHENPPGSVRCVFCVFILDRETALKMEEAEQEKDEALLERIKRLEDALASVLSALQSSPQSSALAQRLPVVNPQATSSRQPHSPESSTMRPPSMKGNEAF